MRGINVTVNSHNIYYGTKADSAASARWRKIIQFNQWFDAKGSGIGSQTAAVSITMPSKAGTTLLGKVRHRTL